MLTAEDILAKDAKYVIRGWGTIPIIFVEGEGAVVKDINGKEYIDCLSQTAGVAGVGHSHPKYVKAITEQVKKISHTLTVFANVPRAILAEKLAKIAPGTLKDNSKMYFACGGSEANETALKFAIMTSGKSEVISTYNAYHGGTLALSGLLGQSWHRGKLPRFPGFHQIPDAYCYRCIYGKNPETCDVECARHLEQHLKYGSAENNVAAFIIEPIKGNGGHQYPMRPEYFQIIRETCDKYNILLVADEIQTGMGRTGKIWACDYFNFSPDIMTTAKALGGGIPVSATVIRSDLVPEELITSQWHIFTMGGSPITMAGAVAAIDIMLEEKLPEKAERQGQRMTKRLKEMEQQHKLIGEIRGPGLFIGIELVKDKKTKEPAIEETTNIFAKCLDRGVLFGLNRKAGYGNVIKIKPVLSISDEQADKALDVFDSVLTEVES